MNDNIKILFIRRGRTRFEDYDLKILSKHFSVTDFQFELNKLHRLVNHVWECDYIYYWFPNDYKFFISVLAKIFFKKIIVVGGGQMATADNKENRLYAGVKYRLFYIFFARMCLKVSDKVIAVSNYEKNGLLRFVNEKKIKLIHNCVDLSIFNFNSKKESNTVLTLSQLNWEYYRRKGLDTFVSIAKQLKNYNFTIIGKDHGDGVKEHILKQNIKNLKILNFISDTDLVSIFRTTDIYCQLSRQEGFGVALAESIACGCAPVLSSEGSLPEVGGEGAFYIDKSRNIKQIQKAIIQAGSSGERMRRVQSDRIIDLCDPKKREKLLVSYILA